MPKIFMFIFVLLSHPSLVVAQYIQPSDLLVVSFVRHSGNLIPIAEHKNNVWDRVENLKHFLSPPNNVWRFYSYQGEQAEIVIEELLIDEAPAPYNSTIDFGSSAKPEQWSDYSPFMIGMAFNQVVETAFFLKVNSVEQHYFYDEIRGKLNEFEAALVTKGEGYKYEKAGISYLDGIPVDDSLRHNAKIRIQISQANNTLLGKELYSFTAEKLYHCAYPTFRGLIIKENSDYEYVAFSNRGLFFRNECENKTGVHYGHIGAFAWKGRIFIPVEVGTWSAVEYDILEMKDTSLHSSVKEFYGDWVMRVSQ